MEPINWQHEEFVGYIYFLQHHACSSYHSGSQKTQESIKRWTWNWLWLLTISGWRWHTLCIYRMRYTKPWTISKQSLCNWVCAHLRWHRHDPSMVQSWGVLLFSLYPASAVPLDFVGYYPHYWPWILISRIIPTAFHIFSHIHGSMGVCNWVCHPPIFLKVLVVW